MPNFDEHLRHFADIVKQKLTLSVFGAGVFLWGATIVILVLQLVVFLKGGEWPKWVLFDLIYSVLPAPFLVWIASPQDWYGLHKVAYLVLESSLPLVTFVLACLCMVGAIKFGSCSEP